MSSNKELGARAAQTSIWAWMPGMRTTDGERVIRVEDDGLVVFDERLGHLSLQTEKTPDLSDPATFGCAMRMLESVTGWWWLAPAEEVYWGVWIRVDWRDELIAYAPTRTEALVTALELLSESEFD